MIIFCHFFIIATIFCGHKEAAKICMRNKAKFRLFVTQSCFYQPESWALTLLYALNAKYAQKTSGYFLWILV